RQVEILKLPGLRKEANEAYASRRLRVSVEQIRSLRSALLLSAVQAFKPDVVLVDKHPFGASGEFKDGLKALRQQGGHAVLGLRDILDDPRQVFREWRAVQHRIANYYEKVLIYGERWVYDAVSAYAFPQTLAGRTVFCGYVFSREDPQALENLDWPFLDRKTRTRPVVLGTAGGGEDGWRLLSTFIRSAAGAPWHGVAIAGPMTPDAELASLEKLAAENHVTFRHYIPHLSALFASVDALVCMGGYNTLVEAAALGVRTVCVPRVEPRIEQLMRGQAFERLGLLQLCHPAELTPATLRTKIDTALHCSPARPQRGGPSLLDFSGARNAARWLLSLVTASELACPAGEHAALAAG
ncbi:MAG TPA: glycosyltransferase, partial [Bacillota bacterium]|nr:glycosyltransferase [Bacillota bacterium]